MAAGDWRPRLQALAHDLEKVQTFYDSLGGIVGYQVTCLELIVAARAKECSHARNGSGSDVGSATEYLVPQGTNLQGAEQRPEAQRAAADGLRAMPELAEIYPLGGAHPPMLRAFAAHLCTTLHACIAMHAARDAAGQTAGRG